MKKFFVNYFVGGLIFLVTVFVGWVVLANLNHLKSANNANKLTAENWDELVCIVASLQDNVTDIYTKIEDQPCNVNGTILAHWESKTFYKQPVSTNCSSATRTCTDGVVSGWDSSYKYVSCRAPRNCTLGGVTVNHDSSYTFYATDHVVICNDIANPCSSRSSCKEASTVRRCNDGTLNWRPIFTYSSCYATSNSNMR